MEARSADRRLRDDVRAARQWATLLLLFRLYLWLLDRGWRVAPGRQGLFGDHRRGVEDARQLRPQSHAQPVWAGPRSREDSRARDRLRFDPCVEAPQIRRRDALSPDR